jgi:hypothetical protein
MNTNLTVHRVEGLLVRPIDGVKIWCNKSEFRYKNFWDDMILRNPMKANFTDSPTNRNFLVTLGLIVYWPTKERNFATLSASFDVKIVVEMEPEAALIRLSQYVYDILKGDIEGLGIKDEEGNAFKMPHYLYATEQFKGILRPGELETI